MIRKITQKENDLNPVQIDARNFCIGIASTTTCVYNSEFIVFRSNSLLGHLYGQCRGNVYVLSELTILET